MSLRAVPLVLLLQQRIGARRNAAVASRRHLAATDGTPLKATYYAAATPGPAVLLLHMCNTTRFVVGAARPQLAAAGIHALAMDYRGLRRERRPALRHADAAGRSTRRYRQMAGDIDSAYAFLSAQPGWTRRASARGRQLRRDRGRPCGPASSRGQVSCAPRRTARSRRARASSSARAWLPIFAAGAADDQYDDNTPELMQWILAHLGKSAQRLFRLQGRQARNRDLRSAP